MSKLDISVPHQLSQEEALNRIKRLAASLQEEKKDMISDLSETWDGYSGSYSFRVKGFTVAPKVFVGVDRLLISGSLPFALSFFKDTISKTIEAEATKLMA